jgi:hypothetical protein
MANRGALKISPVGGDIDIVGGCHVTDADRRHHHHRHQACVSLNG